MPDLPIRPEAIEAATTAYVNESGGKEARMSAALAEFCRVEGLTVARQPSETPGLPDEQRPVGKWHAVEEGR
jgi:hypothetical protein